MFYDALCFVFYIKTIKLRLNINHNIFPPVDLITSPFISIKRFFPPPPLWNFLKTLLQRSQKIYGGEKPPVPRQ